MHHSSIGLHNIRTVVRMHTFQRLLYGEVMLRNPVDGSHPAGYPEFILLYVIIPDSKVGCIYRGGIPFFAFCKHPGGLSLFGNILVHAYAPDRIPLAVFYIGDGSEDRNKPTIL